MPLKQGRQSEAHISSDMRDIKIEEMRDPCDEELPKMDMQQLV